jgi:hypothetical protein
MLLLSPVDHLKSPKNGDSNGNDAQMKKRRFCRNEVEVMAINIKTARQVNKGVVE